MKKKISKLNKKEKIAIIAGTSVLVITVIIGGVACKKKNKKTEESTNTQVNIETNNQIEKDDIYFFINNDINNDLSKSENEGSSLNQTNFKRKNNTTKNVSLFSNSNNSIENEDDNSTKDEYKEEDNLETTGNHFYNGKQIAQIKEKWIQTRERPKKDPNSSSNANEDNQEYEDTQDKNIEHKKYLTEQPPQDDRKLLNLNNVQNSNVKSPHYPLIHIKNKFDQHNINAAQQDEQRFNSENNHTTSSYSNNAHTLSPVVSLKSKNHHNSNNSANTFQPNGVSTGSNVSSIFNQNLSTKKEQQPQEILKSKIINYYTLTKINEGAEADDERESGDDENNNNNNVIQSPTKNKFKNNNQPSRNVESKKLEEQNDSDQDSVISTLDPQNNTLQPQFDPKTLDPIIIPQETNNILLSSKTEFQQNEQHTISMINIEATQTQNENNILKQKKPLNTDSHNEGIFANDDDEKQPILETNEITPQKKKSKKNKNQKSKRSINKHKTNEITPQNETIRKDEWEGDIHTSMGLVGESNNTMQHNLNMQDNSNNNSDNEIIEDMDFTCETAENVQMINDSENHKNMKGQKNNGALSENDIDKITPTHNKQENKRSDNEINEKNNDKKEIKKNNGALSENDMDNNTNKVLQKNTNKKPIYSHNNDQIEEDEYIDIPKHNMDKDHQDIIDNEETEQTNIQNNATTLTLEHPNNSPQSQLDSNTLDSIITSSINTQDSDDILQLAKDTVESSELPKNDNDSFHTIKPLDTHSHSSSGVIVSKDALDPNNDETFDINNPSTMNISPEINLNKNNTEEEHNDSPSNNTDNEINKKEIKKNNGALSENDMDNNTNKVLQNAKPALPENTMGKPKPSIKEDEYIDTPNHNMDNNHQSIISNEENEISKDNLMSISPNPEQQGYNHSINDINQSLAANFSQNDAQAENDLTTKNKLSITIKSKETEQTDTQNNATTSTLEHQNNSLQLQLYSDQNDNTIPSLKKKSKDNNNISILYINQEKTPNLQETMLVSTPIDNQDSDNKPFDIIESLDTHSHSSSGVIVSNDVLDPNNDKTFDINNPSTTNISPEIDNDNNKIIESYNDDIKEPPPEDLNENNTKDEQQ